MTLRSDPEKFEEWLEDMTSSFGQSIAERVLEVFIGFYDEDDKIAVEDIQALIDQLGLAPSEQQLKRLAEELDPDSKGFFLISETRPIFRFLADKLGAVKDVASEEEKMMAFMDGMAAAKMVMKEFKTPGERRKFLNFLEEASHVETEFLDIDDK